MPKRVRLTLFVLYCFVVAFFVFSPVQAQSGTNGLPVNPVYPVSEGYVGNSPLDDFAAPDADAAFRLLRHQQSAEAQSLFVQLQKRHPKDLAVYVGLLQCKPSLLPSELSNLVRQAATGTVSADTQFKLGIALFYTWAIQPRDALRPDSQQLLTRSYALLYQSWQTSRFPIAGLMISDISGYLPAAQRKPINLEKEIAQPLAGTRAFALYRNAKQFHWEGPPPPVSLVAAVNRRPLAGVLQTLWSQNTARVSYGVMRNGKITFVEEPVPAIEVQRAQYLDKWIQALQSATAEAKS